MKTYACLLLLGASLPASADAPGGILELPLTAQSRPVPTAAQIQSFLPARGAFNFPAPYHTRGIRLTNADDCGGGDCVFAVGYSYWRNINNHVSSDTLYAFIGLNRGRGGAGPTLFSYNKVTEETRNLGPLFDGGSHFATRSGEGWYFSGTRPTTLYMNDGPRMLRYDVISRQFETVFDLSSQFGAGKAVWQMTSTDDDRVHSATLMDGNQMLGCVVYDEGVAQFKYFPRVGAFDECHVDRSGRWLMSLEQIDGANDKEMRVFDLATGAERMKWDQEGAAGHPDMGYGYVVGSNNWSYLANAQEVWDFSDPDLGHRLVAQTLSWEAPAPNHVSHTNARPGVPAADQYACGSGAASWSSAPWANEIICFMLDGSLNMLVVAPVMTNMSAASGGDDYNKQPKGNLDVTGQYFIWTTNTGGSRVDAFIVQVPSQLLTGGCTVGPLPGLLGLDRVRAIPTKTSATISWLTGLLSDSLVEYGTTPAYGNVVPSDALLVAHTATLDGLAPGTLYHYRVRSKDLLGNESVSPDCRFMTVPAGTPPAPPPSGGMPPPGDGGGGYDGGIDGYGRGGVGCMPAWLGLFALIAWRRRRR